MKKDKIYDINNSMTAIKFGTDGWRAKMGKEFTFRNVRIFTQAYSNYLKQTCSGSPDKICVFVNYDTRFLSEEFARESARIFTLNGIKVLMPERDAPLAPISLAVKRRNCCGAINFTASFNKPIYNGVKVFTKNGSPALPEVTDAIENEINKIEKDFCFKPQYADSRLISIVDVKSDYMDYITKLVDIPLIQKSGLKIIVDNLYGSSREYLDHILIENDIDAVSIHNFPYSAFGGVISSCGRETLTDLSRLVMREKADLGLATDIDGDRFGIVDCGGHFLSSNAIMPKLIEYLIEIKKMDGGIVKSISTTNNIRKVAEHYGRKIYTTPIGFKFLADQLENNDAFIGVESSNGASLNKEIKIKDGILFSLLITEMRAYYGKKMDVILKDFYLRFPRLYGREIAIERNEKVIQNYKKLITEKNLNLGDRKPDHVNYVDGVKFRFGDSWLLIRESGTNPVIRIYAEATGWDGTRELIKLGRSLIE